MAKYKYARRFADMPCIECGKVKSRRVDMKWQGRCRSCVSKLRALLPHVKAAMRANGRNHPPPRQNVRNYRRGAANNMWRGGITPAIQKIRTGPQIKAWRNKVFERDDYTCQTCGRRGGYLHADHIQPFSLYPELRFEIDNGRTLCIPCHRKYGAKVSAGILIKAARIGDGTNWRIG